MACKGNCIYLGSEFFIGIGWRPVCGFVCGKAIVIDTERPICGNYKTEGAKNTEQSKSTRNPNGGIICS